ncbi:MAG: DNA-binding protein [Chthoniobacterales bacterium]
MPQLIVRKIEELVVQKLQKMAGEGGISVEEAHRRVLRKALLGEMNAPTIFKDYLQTLPATEKELFKRKRRRS